MKVAQLIDILRATATLAKKHDRANVAETFTQMARELQSAKDLPVKELLGKSRDPQH